MNLTMKWVAYGSKDCLALTELRREVLRKPLGMDYAAQQLASEAAQLHLGAWDGENPVGCLLLQDHGHGLIQMRQVAVAFAAQRTGVGRLLVAEAENQARRMKVRRLILHARDTAVGFNQRLGYQVEGEPFVEIGIAHLNMVKEF